MAPLKDAAAAINLMQQKYGGLRPIPGNSTDRCVWFVHISDLHVTFDDPGPANNLEAFAKTVIPVVKPRVVVASGDLTNGVKSMVAMGPILQEWETYKSILTKYGVWNGSFWFDTRGNHDAMFVGRRSSPQNYFPAHGALGQAFQSGGLVVKDLNTTFGSYKFVVIDTNVEPGLALPWTLDGYITDDVAAGFEAIPASHVNGTVVVGHHPIGRLTRVGPLIDFISKHSVVAYLCGHYHMFKLVSRHSAGTIQMLANDHKRRDFARLFVWDHDLLSFSDMRNHTSWPVVVITVPKRAGTLMPSEPYPLIRLSTHVRALVFSPSAITAVRVAIFDSSSKRVIFSSDMHRVDASSPLFVAPWDPDKMPAGLFTVQVNATDADGRKTSVGHSASVDGTPDTLPIYMHQGLAVVSADLVAWLIFVVAVSYVVVWRILMPQLTLLAIWWRGHSIDDWANRVMAHPRWFDRAMLDGSHWVTGTSPDHELQDLGGYYSRGSWEPVVGGGKKWLRRCVLLIVVATLGFFAPLEMGPMIGNQFGAVFAFYGILGPTGSAYVSSITWASFGVMLFALVLPLTVILERDHQSRIDEIVGIRDHQWWIRGHLVVMRMWWIVACVVVIGFLLVTSSGVGTLFLSPMFWMVVVGCGVIVGGHVSKRR